jgi:hypothetical protein
MRMVLRFSVLPDGGHDRDDIDGMMALPSCAVMRRLCGIACRGVGSVLMDATGWGGSGSGLSRADRRGWEIAIWSGALA